MIRLLLVCLVLGWWSSAASAFDAGALGKPDIRLPDGPVSSTVFLISDADGWGWAERRLAFGLRAQGVAVVGIDLPDWIARIDAGGDRCAYVVWDIEALSHQIQRAAGAAHYRSPIVAGIGAGGVLAMAIRDQAPAATLGQILAVDPAPALPLTKPLCPPDPAQASMAGSGSFEVLRSGRVAATRTLDARLLGIAARAAADDSDAPSVIELPARPVFDTLAIVYSGDGGWRDLDRTIAGILQRRGVPTIGIDTLRYFWARKTPVQTAEDLSRLIATYGERWGTRHVLLVGYSFGADLLPATIAALPPMDREKIAQVSLLGLGRTASFEISVAGWVGSDNDGAPTLPDVRRMKMARVQCIFGAEDESACADLRKDGAEVIKTSGGHHFDGDYEALAEVILSGLKRRLGP
ncbi:AcvB/VirJ family lysyl-phosphatidylglycerol hydrolase [Iodidimonas sp. SYSU 1G8]|uniref:virulence factor family protein n=1 Tax=Iodidimonas sp. SYSU 1G8 TaxID=3133967 RepID=UPI0031FE5A81